MSPMTRVSSRLARIALLLLWGQLLGACKSTSAGGFRQHLLKQAKLCCKEPRVEQLPERGWYRVFGSGPPGAEIDYFCDERLRCGGRRADVCLPGHDLPGHQKGVRHAVDLDTICADLALLEQLPRYRRQLRSSNTEVVIAAIRAITRVRATDAVDWLLPIAARSPSLRVRAAALQGIHALARRSVGRLINALYRPDPAEREIAVAALVKVGEEAVPKLLDELRRAPGRSRVCPALRRLVPKSRLPSACAPGDQGRPTP
jgi:hypothetical protein